MRWTVSTSNMESLVCIDGMRRSSSDAISRWRRCRRSQERRGARPWRVEGADARKLADGGATGQQRRSRERRAAVGIERGTSGARVRQRRETAAVRASPRERSRASRLGLGIESRAEMGGRTRWRLGKKKRGAAAKQPGGGSVGARVWSWGSGWAAAGPPAGPSLGLAGWGFIPLFFIKRFLFYFSVCFKSYL
jgi:hypothetical protein